MRTVLALTAALLLVLPLGATAQDVRATLTAAARALGPGGLPMVHLPKEKLVSEADVFTPLPAGTPPAAPLAVDQPLPLQGRLMPIADLYTAVGHGR